jgi:hypothetical protein
MKMETLRPQRAAEPGVSSPSRRAVLGALLAGAATAGAWTSASAAAVLQTAGAAPTPKAASRSRN